MTTFALSGASPAKSRADAVVVGVVQGEQRPSLAPGADDVAKAYGRKLTPLLASLGVTGKAGEVVKIPTAGTLSTPLLVLVGLGAEPTTDAVRRAGGVAARALTNAASVALALPADSSELVRALTEGFLLGGYTFTAYRSSAKDRSAAEVVVLSSTARRKATIAALEEAQLVADAVATTREWVNLPPNDCRPADLADLAVAAAKATKGVKTTVHDEAALTTMGAGGILAVGLGSAAPPRLVELHYRPRKAVAHVALVGKGITYDSGGLSIKTAAGMTEMKSDMAGAATVVNATLAIARLGLPVQVSAYAALAENMISGSAMRPGDVITMLNGATVEILNTDAEGRLVLGDALHLAAQQEPDVLIDVATLTGAMVVALGDKVTGVMGDAAVVDDVLAAAAAAGEHFWPMPIPEHMDERIHSSTIADLAQHDWIRWGGGLFAAAFLREFTGGLPWAHLDIAGPAFASGGPSGHVTSGGTGVAVATLVEYVKALAERD